MGVAIPAGTETTESSDAVERLTGFLASDLSGVNRVITERMHSPVAMIPNLAGYLISAGGKRLRPLLTLAAARLLNYEGDHHIKLAAAVEFIHTATLLHDDVVDESALRRGRASANLLWGNKASVLVGDFLFSRSFQLMVEVGSLEVLKVLSEASAVIAEGEVMQLSTANDTSTTEAAYMEVISAKTAALFAAAARSGALIADATPKQEEAFRSYGHNLGIAFQLVDDALDYSGQQAQLGKKVGDDFRDGKITLPIVLAYKSGSQDDKAFWQRTLEDGEQEPADLDRAISMLDQMGALDETVRRARHFGQLACEALDALPNNALREALNDIVAFCISRTY